MGWVAGSAIFSKNADDAWAFLEGLFRYAPMGVAFFDRQCRYIRVNAALATRNGVPAAEHAGRHVCEVAPGEAANVEHAVLYVLTSGKPIRISSGTEVVDYYPVRVGNDTIGVGAIVTSETPPLSSDGERSLTLTRAASCVEEECPSGLAPGPAMPSQALEGSCILVVDDDSDTRDLLVEIVTSAGGRAIAAESAEQGLQVLRSRHADVIICDVGMPDRDGYSFLRELRSSGEEAGGWTPAIALTGYASVRDSQTALLAGFQMHLPKPVDPPILLECLVKLWRRGPRDNEQ